MPTPAALDRAVIMEALDVLTERFVGAEYDPAAWRAINLLRGALGLAPVTVDDAAAGSRP